MATHSVKYNDMDELSYMLDRMSSLVEPSLLKVVTSAVLSGALFFFGSVYNDALVAIAMLMAIDTVLGVAAAWHNGEAIKSRRFSRVVLKGIIYFTAISAGYFADLTMPFNIIQGTMVAFVGVTEFISILENVGRMGYKTPKRLLNDLREYQETR